MKTIKVLLIVLCSFVFQNSMADAMPKGYQLYKFETEEKVDSLFVFESDKKEDLKKIDFTSKQRPNVTICNDNSCRAKASQYKKYQRIVVFVKGEPIESILYEPKGTNSTFRAKIIEDEVYIVETTSFIFKGKLGEILRALLITLILELIIGILFFGFKNKKALQQIFIINCITLPIAWLLFPIVLKIPGFSIVLTIVVLEVLVLMAEYFWYSCRLKNYSKGKLFSYALIGNLVSFFIGGLLYVITLFI